MQSEQLKQRLQALRDKRREECSERQMDGLLDCLQIEGVPQPWWKSETMNSGLRGGLKWTPNLPEGQSLSRWNVADFFDCRWGIQQRTASRWDVAFDRVENARSWQIDSESDLWESRLIQEADLVFVGGEATIGGSSQSELGIWLMAKTLPQYVQFLSDESPFEPIILCLPDRDMAFVINPCYGDGVTGGICAPRDDRHNVWLWPESS